MPLRLLRQLLDIAAPRLCSACGRRLNDGEEVFCATCMMRLPRTDFLAHPYDNEMAQTFWGRVSHFEKAYAFVYHQPHSESARAVYQIKYFGMADTGIDIGEIMGRQMKAAGFTDDIDIILPVPLTKERKRQRGFNQSEMIAQGISDATGIKVAKDIVKRVSFHGSQTRRDRQDRADNVENAFCLASGKRVTGKHVLIVDDIVTTGATIVAMAQQITLQPGVKVSVAAIGFAGERIYENSGREEDEDNIFS
ncbi:MAG TPA: amidophosphoribosyltransferase [Prevotella sp.]|nr:amidophosphoribosyltransferase [Prevotella sp.]